MSKEGNEAIRFITGNSEKAEQLSRYFEYPVTHQVLDIPEIQSLNLHQVVEHKAMAAYKEIKKPVLVEDVSLKFNALGNLPGPLIKWFLEEMENEGLCRLLDNYENRTAIAEVAFCYYDGKSLQVFNGQREGSVSREPKGEAGFGWDPIFIPKGYSKTWGEMGLEEQRETSMRIIALEKLERFLRDN